MNLSYWEYKSWLSDIDFTIVGSGIVGLTCAMALRLKYPSSKILILEKGVLPQGASTKNAGFACYGSLSEILSDMKTHPEEQIVDLVRMRWDGIAMLRNTLSDDAMDFLQCGGHELFLSSETDRFEECLLQMDRVNELLEPVFNQAAFEKIPNSFKFEHIKDHYISNPLEGQLDTGKMMHSLLQKVQKNEIGILNSITVTGFNQLNDGVEVQTDHFHFRTGKLMIATNGFASRLLKEAVQPARAQVLITKPIPNLHIRGTFHMDEGYYYFRNVDNRILLGGARHLDFEGERTSQFGLTSQIQNKLEDVLAQVILPANSFEIDRRWSGIMGMGEHKKPVLKPISEDVFCGVRLGGMGIAIGSHIGKSLAELLD